MTPKERAMLQRIGRVITANLSPFSISIFLYGLFAPLLFCCIYTLLRKTSGVISRELLVLVILGFAMSTTYCVASLSGQIITLRVLVTDPAEALADKRSDASAQLYMMEILILWSSRITPIINDILIMWRGWSMLSRIRWAKFLAFPLLITATATTFISLGLEAGARGYDSERTPQMISLFVIGMSLSLAINALVTLSIGWILWKHKKLLQLNARTTDTQSINLWRFLFLLLESGAIYCVLQLITTVLNACSFPDTSLVNTISAVVLSAYAVFSAMYPTILVLLIYGPYLLLENLEEANAQTQPYTCTPSMPVFMSSPNVEQNVS